MGRRVSGPILVCYDVFDDERRARLRAALTDIADRFQQSGWLVPPGPGPNPDRLATTLGDLLLPADRLLLHSPCRTCARTARSWPPNTAHTLLPHQAWVAP
jgi:hypothetical protein